MVIECKTYNGFSDFVVETCCLQASESDCGRTQDPSGILPYFVRAYTLCPRKNVTTFSSITLTISLRL